MPFAPTQDDAIAKVNDCLRGTIIVKNVDSCKQLIQHLTTQANRAGMQIAYSNKYDGNAYPNGYFGIHARLHFNSPTGDKILAEIQIHFEMIENGSADCPSQDTHKTYELVRSLATSNLPKDKKEELEKLGDLASKAQFAMGMQQVA
ncbi:MAG: hypothetical protein LLG04_10125 [Parachlamydia sp.]|nr:hypothetical protein [Parachlamydia sp.]